MFSSIHYSTNSQDDLNAILQDVSRLLEPEDIHSFSTIDSYSDSYPSSNSSFQLMEENYSPKKRSYESMEISYYPMNKKQMSSCVSLPKKLTKVIQENKEENQDICLNTIHLMMDVYNLDSDYHLFRLIHRFSTSDLQLTIVSSSLSHKLQTISPNALFAFFYLAQESYPDGLNKILDRRIYSQDNVKEILKVEYIYRFSGTRITKHSLLELLSLFVTKEEQPSFVVLSYDELTLSLMQHVMKHEYLRPQQTYDQITCDQITCDQITNVICSVMVTFNMKTNLISHYDLEVLATEYSSY